MKNHLPAHAECGTAFEIMYAETSAANNMKPITNQRKTSIFTVYLVLITMLYGTLFFLSGCS